MNNACLLITDYLDERVENRINDLASRGYRITDVLYLYKSDYELKHGIYSSDLDHFYDHSMDAKILNYSGTVFDNLKLENKSLFGIEGFDLLNYFDIAFKGRLNELLKIYSTLNNFLLQKPISKIFVYNFKREMTDFLPLLCDIPIENLVSHASNFKRRLYSCLSNLIYQVLMVPKNHFIRFINLSIFNKKTIMMIGIKKSGKLYKFLLDKGYHLITVGGFIPIFDNCYLGGESIKMSHLRSNFDPGLISKVRFNQSLYDGRDFSPLLQKIMTSHWNIFSQCKFLNAFLRKRKDINYLLINCDPLDYAGLAQDWALKNKIPVTILQHGLYAINSRLSRYKSDKIFVWGNLSKKWFSKNMVHEKKILVSGCPAYKVNFIDKNLTKDFKIKNILVALTWHVYYDAIHDYNTNHVLVSNIIEVLKNFNDIGLIIKLHPEQSKKEFTIFHKLAEHHKNLRIEIYQNYSLNQLFKKAQVCFSEFSTTGLEAIMNGVLFIKTDYQKTKIDHLYTSSGKIPIVGDQKETVQLLDRLLSNKSVYEDLFSKEMEFYKDYVSYENHEACDRIIDSIEKSLK